MHFVVPPPPPPPPFAAITHFNFVWVHCSVNKVAEKRKEKKNAWMGSWEAKGYKIVSVDTTTEVCTGEEIGAAKEILEKIIKKSVV